MQESRSMKIQFQAEGVIELNQEWDEPSIELDVNDQLRMLLLSKLARIWLGQMTELTTKVQRCSL